MSNSVGSKSLVLPASGFVTVHSGNLFFLVSAGAAVDVEFYGVGTSSKAEQVLGGFEQGFVEGWQRCILRGIAGTSVTYFAGNAEVREDYIRYSRTVGVFQQQLPQVRFDAADVDIGGSAAAVQIIAFNAARDKVTVKVRDDATVKIRAGRDTVTATRGVQLGSGEAQTFYGPDAVYAIREAVGTAFVTLNGENA